LEKKSLIPAESVVKGEKDRPLENPCIEVDDDEVVVREVELGGAPLPPRRAATPANAMRAATATTKTTLETIA